MYCSEKYKNKHFKNIYKFDNEASNMSIIIIHIINTTEFDLL